MKQAIFLLLALLVGYMAGMQSGTKRKQPAEVDSPSTTPAEISQKETSPQEPDCTNPKGVDQQIWCTARNSYNEYSEQAKNPDNLEGWNKYLEGYKDGLYDAHHARSLKVPEESSVVAEYDLGYSKGYDATMEAMGLVTYDCATEAVQSEYQARWCEAADLFVQANIGDRAGNNPVLRTRFIDGYMSGESLALVIPATVGELLVKAGTDTPDSRLPLVMGQQDSDLPEAAKAFRDGLEQGYSSMVDKVQDIISQVMQQFMFSPRH
ncbi:hypothetical protein ACWJJH_05275 [Endozoicomonadaceae bacterium StTr2]